MTRTKDSRRDRVGFITINLNRIGYNDYDPIIHPGRSRISKGYSIALLSKGIYYDYWFVDNFGPGSLPNYNKDDDMIVSVNQ